ncbi:MAG: hypothetical protein ACOYM7_05120 [Paludibacter sp.]
MIQEIIVYVILLFVIVYSIYIVIKKVSTKPTSVCEDCTGCGIKQEMIKKGKTTTHDCSYVPISTKSDSNISKN